MTGNRLLFGMMAWGAASIASAAPLTPAQQAFADAKALAASAQANAVANLSSGGVSSTVNQFNPTYYNSNGTAPESALFQGGNGNTVSAGQSKVADCQNGTPNPDPFLRQNCEAINLMVNNPSNRPQFSLPASMFASSKAIEAQGITDPNATGSFTGCVDKATGSLPTTELCQEWFGIASQQCTIGRVILVDVNTNYQCDKTVDTYLPQTCDRTVNVTVTPQNPIQTTNNPIGINAGDVPGGQTRTASNNLVVDTSKRYVMTYFHGDNYGQLWVNGRLVYDATYSIGFTDIRGALLKYHCVGTGRNESCNTEWLMTNGNYAGYYDVGCPWGSPCMGVSTALDLAPYLTTGGANNLIELACANVGGPGPCNATISVFSCPANFTIAGTGISATCVPPAVVTSTINNGCAIQEAAAL
ncbi:hypothetical protein [Devosia sp.]|uniref:hypothetical protein n=1 Tax=Devosia sp. TaxID=1871048 RepID=UPI00273343CE|nr:hypothetical protein [Devosia sp.]MDP2781065.1 hypothetical protein [Devosia sp.]